MFFVDGTAGKQLAGIYMYTHWSGSFLPAIVRAALKRGQGRWGDSQYLARIVFCELVQETVMEETGFGLSTQIGDNEHAIVRVDDNEQRVSFHDPGSERNPKDKGTASWSYAEFVAAKDQTLLSAFAPELEEDAEAELPKATAKPAAKRKPVTKSKAKPATNAKPARPVTKVKSKRAK